MHLRATAPKQVDKGRIERHDCMPQVDEVIFFFIECVTEAAEVC